MKIIFRIRRFNPERDEIPFFQEYRIDVDPTDRVLDALIKIKTDQDSSLGFRRSCSHGVCGSDAMVINGMEGLACKTLIKDVTEREGDYVTIEPLRTLPVQRDLIVDQAPFFQNYRKVKPYMINPEPVEEKERIQTPEKRMEFDDATRCILCAACFSACPVKRDVNPSFLGPAAVVQAARFLDDDRDRGFAERVPELDYPDGIWPCENRFECTRVCPRNIKVTKLINQTKRKITALKKGEEKI